MKSLNLIILSILVLLTSSCVISGWDNRVTGNGNVMEEIRDIDGFKGVHISSGIDVILSEGDDYEVVVEADENLHEYIEIYKNGGILVVGTEDHVSIGNAKSKRVHVSLPELEVLKISSAGDCEGRTIFHCENLKINISSAGDLDLEVLARQIDLDISSSGDARLAGEAEILNISLSSAGDLDAKNLTAAKVDVSVSSAGDARVHATDEISMRASSAGSIFYSGDAQIIHKSKSSAGSIVKR